MKIVYDLFLTFNATVFVIIVFLIKNDCKIFKNTPEIFSFGIYIMFVVIVTLISLGLTKLLSKDSIEGRICDVSIANENFLPTYLGYFFVGLELDTYDTLIYVFLILFVFTFFSQTMYFNPMFLIFRYKFYNITMDNNVKILVISRRELNAAKELKFNNLRRINNYTFFDKER